MATTPRTNSKLMVRKLTTSFRDAVSIETTEMCHPRKSEVCVKNKYVGINASDVNISKGRYFTDGKIPFAIGFEGVGEVVALGDDVSSLKVGQSVAYMSSKANVYAEYSCIPATDAFPIPAAKPEFLPLLVSGLTASIGLDKSAHIMAGETVLITAAAGGAGHMAVQWAKAAECHVIGMCSSEDKEKFLESLGCDRIINYKKEDLEKVLTKEYPKGVDVVWETIGGDVFTTCLRHLAVKGRLVVVGQISSYKDEKADAMARKDDLSTLPSQLLMKSASVQGFFLSHYRDCFASYIKFMSESMKKGELTPATDDGKKTGAEFVGMSGIIDAVEYLHSGKSIGKVVARVY